MSIFIRTASGALLNEFLLMMPSASSERVAAILPGKIEEHAISLCLSTNLQGQSKFWPSALKNYTVRVLSWIRHDKRPTRKVEGGR